MFLIIYIILVINNLWIVIYNFFLVVGLTKEENILKVLFFSFINNALNDALNVSKVQNEKLEIKKRLINKEIDEKVKK